MARKSNVACAMKEKTHLTCSMWHSTAVKRMAEQSAGKADAAIFYPGRKRKDPNYMCVDLPVSECLHINSESVLVGSIRLSPKCKNPVYYHEKDGRGIFNLYDLFLATMQVNTTEFHADYGQMTFVNCLDRFLAGIDTNAMFGCPVAHQIDSDGELFMGIKLVTKEPIIDFRRALKSIKRICLSFHKDLYNRLSETKIKKPLDWKDGVVVGSTEAGGNDWSDTGYGVWLGGGKWSRSQHAAAVVEPEEPCLTAFGDDDSIPFC